MFGKRLRFGHGRWLQSAIEAPFCMKPSRSPARAMTRLIMHVDLDAFYAAIEQRDHPDWHGLPVVVGAEPGKRGVVATCSYEARGYGVHSAMPISEASRRLPPEIIGQRAKAAIREAVALTASVGIGPNRLIAKLASDYRKPDGLTVVLPEQVREFLDPMPLTALRGVGVKTAPRLQRMGLKTVGDVRRPSLEELRKQLGARAGTQVHLQARGIAGDQVYPDSERKSISKETTFVRILSTPRCFAIPCAGRRRRSDFWPAARDWRGRWSR
jgi:DNA polymerase-4